MDPTDGLVPNSAGNVARQKFKSLKTRWGVQDDLDWQKPPMVIFVEAMGYRELWKQRKDMGPIKKPDDVEFDLIEKEKLNGQTPPAGL